MANAREHNTYFDDPSNWIVEKETPFEADTLLEVKQILLDALAARGDDGTSPRNVMHRGLRAREGALDADAMLTHMMIKFSMKPSGYGDSDTICFEHESEIASEKFDELVFQITMFLQEKGWDYDNWTTQILTQSH